MSSKYKYVFALIVVAAACFAQTSSRVTLPGQTESARPEETLRQINEAGRYCRATERLQLSVEPISLFFSQGQWYQGTPSRNVAPDTVALVWLRHGRVVAAAISSQASDEMGAERTNYCFREDGTLARVAVLPLLRSSGRAGLHQEVIVGRTVTYLANGQKFQMPRIPDVGFDPHVLKSERTTFRFVEPPAVYKTVEELPFIRLIIRQV